MKGHNHLIISANWYTSFTKNAELNANKLQAQYVQVTPIKTGKCKRTPKRSHTLLFLHLLLQEKKEFITVDLTVYLRRKKKKADLSE